MNCKVVFLKDAESELYDAYEWYEEQQPLLGDKFKTELYKRIDLISKFPERYPIRHDEYRETPINIYPYTIIYKFIKEKKEVIIYSIFYTRRNPTKKYR